MCVGNSTADLQPPRKPHMLRINKPSPKEARTPWWLTSSVTLVKPLQRFATSLRQPHPPGAVSPSFAIPDASHIRMTTSRTALTSSTVAPLFSAPFRWPLSCGLTCHGTISRASYVSLKSTLTSCGMSPASKTKLLSAALRTLVLLRI